MQNQENNNKTRARDQVEKRLLQLQVLMLGNKIKKLAIVIILLGIFFIITFKFCYPDYPDYETTQNHTQQVMNDKKKNEFNYKVKKYEVSTQTLGIFLSAITLILFAVSLHFQIQELKDLRTELGNQTKAMRLQQELSEAHARAERLRRHVIFNIQNARDKGFSYSSIQEYYSKDVEDKVIATIESSSKYKNLDNEEQINLLEDLKVSFEDWSEASKQAEKLAIKKETKQTIET